MDWRDNGYRTSGSLEQAKSALQQIKSTRPAPDNASDVGTYTCTLVNKEIKGKLILTDKSLKFVSQHGNLSLKISLTDIQSITSKAKFLIGEFLHIETSKGELVFALIDCEAEKVKDKITAQKDSTEASPAGDSEAAAPVQDTKRKKVALEASELAFIEVRKAKIINDLMDKKKLSALNKTVIYKDIGIDDFYDILYSDSPKVIKGKKYDCPAIYFYQQLGSYKIKSIAYKNPGPKFYTAA